jgi:hypothetical protein
MADIIRDTKQASEGKEQHHGRVGACLEAVRESKFIFLIRRLPEHQGLVAFYPWHVVADKRSYGTIRCRDGCMAGRWEWGYEKARKRIDPRYRCHPIDALKKAGFSARPGHGDVQAHFCSSYRFIFSTSVVRLTWSSLAALFLTHLVFSSE